MGFFLLSLMSLNALPSNREIVIAWDLHSVLFYVDWYGWVMNLAMYALFFGLFFLCVYAFCGIRGILFSLAPLMIVILDFGARIVFFSIKNGHRPVIEHVWDADPLLRSLKPEFVRFENLYIPNKDVFEIVQKLKSQGYTLCIASNIAPDTLKCLRGQYPEYFALFDGSISPNEKNGWCDKKQPQKFFQLLQHNVGNKRIIFIDDSSVNCSNAQDCGITGIWFSGDIKKLKTDFAQQEIVFF